LIADWRRLSPRKQLSLHRNDIDQLLSLIEQMAERVAVPPYTGAPALPDPADWPFIACALAVGCPVVTGNARHFPKRTGVIAMTEREWVAAGKQPGG
jgi:hypothetical protein